MDLKIIREEMKQNAKKMRKLDWTQQETKRWTTNCTMRYKIIYRYITGK